MTQHRLSKRCYDRCGVLLALVQENMDERGMLYTKKAVEQFIQAGVSASKATTTLDPRNPLCRLSFVAKLVWLDRGKLPRLLQLFPKVFYGLFNACLYRYFWLPIQVPLCNAYILVSRT